MSKTAILLLIATQIGFIVWLVVAAIYLDWRRSESGASAVPMSSPLIAVVKRNGQVRLCVAKAAQDGSQDVECSPWR